MKDHFISVDQARYDTFIVAKYLDNDTANTTKSSYTTNLTSDTIFTRDDACTSDEKVDRLTRELNIHYRACIWSLIYLLSTRVDLSFAVHKLAKFSSNPGKVTFEGLVHLLRYIIDNNTLGLKYYADRKDAPLSELLRQANINTNNLFMVWSDYSWQDFPNTGRITGAYIIFYKGGKIDYGTYVLGPVAQPGAESEYNTAWNSWMNSAHFRMLIN